MYESGGSGIRKRVDQVSDSPRLSSHGRTLARQLSSHGLQGAAGPRDSEHRQKWLPFHDQMIGMANDRLSPLLIALLLVGGYCCIWASGFILKYPQREALLAKSQNDVLEYRAQQNLANNIGRLYRGGKLSGTSH